MSNVKYTCIYIYNTPPQVGTKISVKPSLLKTIGIRLHNTPRFYLLPIPPSKKQCFHGAPIHNSSERRKKIQILSVKQHLHINGPPFAHPRITHMSKEHQEIRYPLLRRLHPTKILPLTATKRRFAPEGMKDYHQT